MNTNATAIVFSPDGRPDPHRRLEEHVTVRLETDELGVVCAVFVPTPDPFKWSPEALTNLGRICSGMTAIKGRFGDKSDPFDMLCKMAALCGLPYKDIELNAVDGLMAITVDDPYWHRLLGEYSERNFCTVETG
ncbi:MAG: hypothetical protein WCO52_00840 [bacterium]